MSARGLALPPPFEGKATFTAPVGWPAIVEFYGWSPKRYLGADGRARDSWRADAMVLRRFPEPCSLSWDPAARVTRYTVHKKAAPAFELFYERVHDAGLWTVIRVFAGIYEFRRIGGSSKLSLHSLAAAADHDPDNNERGVEPEETTIGGTAEGHEVIRIAEEVGLVSGARFSTIPDAQHVQFARGY